MRQTEREVRQRERERGKTEGEREIECKMRLRDREWGKLYIVYQAIRKSSHSTDKNIIFSLYAYFCIALY